VATALGYPRSASLRQPAEFTALRRLGKRMAARFFQTQYRLTDSVDARLGMAVSRRVSKRAVVRNRIRRVIRESFRLNRARLPACDVLLIAQTTAAEQSSSVLRADLESLWQRLAALKYGDPAGTMPARS
jgi:ribonuclease P protein component